MPMELPCGDLWEPQEMQAWISRGKTERRPKSRPESMRNWLTERQCLEKAGNQALENAHIPPADQGQK